MKNNIKLKHDNRLVAFIFSLAATALCLLGSVSLDQTLPAELTIAGSFFIGISVFFGCEALLRNRLKEKLDDSRMDTIIKKLVAGLLVASVFGTVAATLRSLSMYPTVDLGGDRFVYENLATGLFFSSIFLTFILSSLQKDQYWVRRRRSNVLDERQLKQRQEVLEVSYWIGLISIVVISILFIENVKNIPVLINNNYGSVPGHLKLLPFSLIVAFHSIPLVVASFKKNK